jgi:hypothetical protein
MSKKIKISEKNLKTIYGENYADFKNKIISGCWCANCKVTSIVNYQVYLNELDDVILEGFCTECNHRVNRYVETGENPKYVERIRKIKNKLDFALGL